MITGGGAKEVDNCTQVPKVLNIVLIAYVLVSKNAWDEQKVVVIRKFHYFIISKLFNYRIGCRKYTSKKFQNEIKIFNFIHLE